MVTLRTTSHWPGVGIPKLPETYRRLQTVSAADAQGILLCEQAQNVTLMRLPMPVEDRGVQRVPLFEVPLSPNEVIVGDPIPEGLLDKVLVWRNGRLFCRVMVDPEDDQGRFGALLSDPDVLRGQHVSAARTTSYRTWWMFADKEDVYSHYLKIDGEWRRHQADDFRQWNDLTPQVVRETVQKSAWLAERTLQHPSSSFGYLPEPIAFCFERGGVSFSQIVRLSLPYGGLSPDHILVPLHGIMEVLGRQEKHYSMNQLAEMAGMSRAQWAGHFLEKFAESYADAVLTFGIHPQCHAQNTLVEIDQKTGRIGRIVYRDLNDARIDPWMGSLSPKGDLVPLPFQDKESYLRTVDRDNLWSSGMSDTFWFMEHAWDQVIALLLMGDANKETIFNEAFIRRGQEVLGEVYSGEKLDREFFPGRLGLVTKRYQEILEGATEVPWEIVRQRLKGGSFCSHASDDGGNLWSPDWLLGDPQVEPEPFNANQCYREKHCRVVSYQKRLFVLEKETGNPVSMIFDPNG